MRDSYDLIVIGGGHAGTEAAWAAASVLEGAGGRVALITMDPARIGQMSCNPAIGGLAKGQMVREIDALGGVMGRAIDATGIMFKMLNTSKGPAVWGPRAQADKYAYAAEVQRLISTRPNIDVIAATVDDLIVEDGRIVGVVLPRSGAIHRAHEQAIEWNQTNNGQARPVLTVADDPPAEPGANGTMVLRTRAVVLTTGTFMRGLMHTGERRTEGGRVDEGSAVGISGMLRRLGFELGRLKTGTPPRLARESIDWDGLDEQVGDSEPVPFSDLTMTGERIGALSRDGGARLGEPTRNDAGSDPILSHFPVLPQSDCRVTHTTAEAHELIRANLDRAPMYTGQIEAECGPRYCPSIEDKVVRFADRPSHHVFLEPESLHTHEIYCNGISTSLPIDVQERIVHLMPGCERAEILRWGYAVEYDMVWPHQIDSTCETKLVRGLFLAGQINCTTGYEEAGAQGVVAGLNAARLTCGAEPIRLGRETSYIGVMLDDLVTKTPREPYRMFTSRAEHRLLLRADNADERLTPVGRELGLIDDLRWRIFESRNAEREAIAGLLAQTSDNGRPLSEIARRPEVTIDDVAAMIEQPVDARSLRRVITDSRYAGYIARQRADIKRAREADERTIPEWLDPREVAGLRAEAAEVLQRFRPRTLGQAGRLAGINPADLTLLAVAIRRGRCAGTAQPAGV